MKTTLLAGALSLLLSSGLFAAKTLDMWAIDTEGGKALLLVSPSGQSMLIDTGFPGYNDRDANRIVEAAKAAGVSKLDFLVVTHYDLDHVANVPSTVAKLPVATFVDHGEPSVKDPGTTKYYAAYAELAAKAKRVIVKPGDQIPFKGVDVLVLTSAGEAIRTPLKGAGAPNPYCDASPAKTWPRGNEDTSENGHSIGLLFTFGKFRMVDMGDLTWNRERELMCPNNPIGTVDLFMVSHHGNDISNSPALVQALKPRVAVMDNGPRKIGAASVVKLIRSSEGMEGPYQLHWSANAPNDNPPEEFLANLQNSPDGKWIKVSVEKNGTITVTNGRTGQAKVFRKK